MNQTRIATLVAMFFYTVFLVVGTANAQTPAFQEINERMYVTGQVTAYVQTDECTQKNVWVSFTDENSDRTKIAGWRTEIITDRSVTIQVNMHVIDFCENSYSYFWGESDVEPTPVIGGKIEMAGEVTITDEDGENHVMVTIDVGLTGHTNGFYGGNNNKSGTWGANAYKSTYDVGRIWADAIAEGYISIEGIEVRVDDQIGEVSINSNRNKTESSEPISQKG